MKNEIIDQAYQWWAENNYIGRDTFLFVVKSLQSKNKIEIKYHNKTIIFHREDWMSDISNIRDLYYSLMAIDDNLEDNKILQKDEKVNAVVDNTKSELAILKDNQRLHDSNLSIRKHLRENFRQVNNSEILLESLITEWKKLDLGNISIKHEVINNTAVGLIQVGDLHIGKRVNKTNSKYDLEILAKRLKLLAIKAKKYFSLFGIKEIVVSYGGDTITSNHRRSQDKNMVNSRTNATYIGAFILAQFLLDLNKDFNIAVVSVIGNESRIADDFGWEYNIFTESFDLIVHQFLKVILRSAEGIVFNGGDSLEEVITLNGQNILILHGHSIRKHTDDEIQKKIGQYSYGRKINIDYVLLHHIHSTFISKVFARAGAMDGGDAYANEGLGLDGKASQNLGVFYDNGTSDMICLNLDNIDNIEGYKFVDAMPKNIKKVEINS